MSLTKSVGCIQDCGQTNDLGLKRIEKVAQGHQKPSSEIESLPNCPRGEACSIQTQQRADGSC